MNTHQAICQGCQQHSVEVREPTQSKTDYELCTVCHRRLITFSLRPIEWYRLVSIHGKDFYLHDDFYTEEGIATQPQPDPDKSVETIGYAMPQIPDVQEDLPNLLKLALVRYEHDYEHTIYQKIRKFPGKAIWQILFDRYQITSESMQCDILGMMEIVVPTATLDQNWLLTVWKEKKDQFIEAVLHREKISKMIIDKLNDQYCIYTLSKLLCQFLSKEILEVDFLDFLGKIPADIAKPRLCFDQLGSDYLLDWIEQHGDIGFPLKIVAMNAKISWQRLVRWFTHSRSLKYAALDILQEYAIHHPELFDGIYLPQKEHIREVLLPLYENGKALLGVRHSIVAIFHRLDLSLV